MKFKVCGMRDKKNIEDLKLLHPDYMGFIFWPKSSRFVSQNTPKLPSHIKKTGVFVDAKFNYIKSCVEKHQLQVVQLHGEETPEYCSQIKSLKVEVIKTFSIKKFFDFNILKPYESNCDFFLFDSKGKLPGGNGYAFDWSILNDYASKKPFFLSGGIGLDDIESIGQLLKTKLPLFAIDVNSEFEIKPALKNIKKLIDFKYQLYEL